ncbi:MAG: MmgE/PrpD family protein [Alphaproteobacteria bacterium]
MTSVGSIASRLARFVAGLSLDDIPGDSRHHARLQLLDAIGIALASSTQAFGRRAADGLQLLSEGDALVIGLPHRLAVRDAILVNGILIHGLDFDDTSIHGRVHPSSFCVPPALTLAVEKGLSGAELLTAYIAGLECAIRIGGASKGGFPRNGFDAGGIVSPFATSLVAGKLLGLTETELTLAQGLALSTAGGTREFIDAMAWTKRMHPGWGGVGGATAALLAKGGFRGPALPYEGRFGLYAQYVRDGAEAVDLALATEGLGTRWHLDDVSFKPLPACYFNIAPIDAAAALARRHDLTPGDIARVTVLLPEAAVNTVCEPAALKRHPDDGYAGEFSVYYTVAAALARRGFSLADHGDDALGDPVVQALAQKVDYEIDPRSTFPKYYSAAVIVTTRDGRRLEHREDIHRGAPERPLGEETVTAKFTDNATRAVDARRADTIRDTVMGLETLDDARVFRDLLRPA